MKDIKANNENKDDNTNKNGITDEPQDTRTRNTNNMVAHLGDFILLSGHEPVTIKIENKPPAHAISGITIFYLSAPIK